MRRLGLLVLMVGLVLGLLPAPSASAALPMTGDAFLYYATQGSATSPYKNYTATSNSWSAASTLGTEANALHFERTVNSPLRNERLTMLSNTNGLFEMYRFNGSSWVLDWTDSNGGSSANANTPRFDIAYGADGNAVAFYNNENASAQMAYRRYTASTGTWSTKQTYVTVDTHAGGPIRYVRVENRPGTDEFAVVWADYDQNVSGNYYDFSGAAFSGEPSAPLQDNLSITSAMAATAGPYTSQTKSFDIAFETQSGDLLVCYGHDGTADLYCNTRSAGTGGTWGARIIYTAVNAEMEDIDLASDPNPSSNQIAMVGYDSALADVEAALWSGTAWGSRFAVDTSADTLGIGTSNVAIGWVRSGSTSAAVLTYDDLDSAGIDWATLVGTTWTLRTDSTLVFSPASGNDIWHEIETNPNNLAQMASIIIDVNADLSVKRMTFDGVNFTWSSMDNGSATHNATMHTTGGWAAAFAFANYLIPAVLSVDFIDTNEASVAAPSASLATLASSSSCQTTTGTLGTSAQRIRVLNGTTNAPWTLSIAATGGTTAQWSATTDTYDYNDTTSSGCADGADADSSAGRLGFGPSTATITPAGTCASTGVTAPSTTYFNEGVVNSITLVSGGATANIGCYWDITGVNVYQAVPRFQLAGTYSIPLTLTITAN